MKGGRRSGSKGASSRFSSPSSGSRADPSDENPVVRADRSLPAHHHLVQMTPLKLNGPAARIGAACARAACRPVASSSPATRRLGPPHRAYSSLLSSSSAVSKGRIVALSALALLSAGVSLSLTQRIELDALPPPPARKPGLTDPLRLIPAKEVLAHTAEDDCWVIINDKVWDVTEFLELHPGGAEVIVNNSGRDATSVVPAALARAQSRDADS